MIIINQDHDRTYVLNQGEEPNIYTVAKDEMLIGFNLMLYGKLLGTFDTYAQAEKELTDIMTSKEEIHTVSGYSDWRSNDIELVD